MLAGGPRVVGNTAAFQATVWGSFHSLGGLNISSPSTRKIRIVGSLRDREVAFSASDLQGLNFESCVWRAVSSSGGSPCPI